MEPAEFIRIRDAHGLSVALRAAYASDRARRVFPDGIGMFYAMYSDGAKDGLLAAFDPTIWHRAYEGNAWAKGRAHWAKELGESHPDSFKEIGAVVTASNEERAAYVAALPEGEWKDFISGLSDADLLDIWCLIYRQWPLPVRAPGDEAIPNEPEMAARHVRILKARP